MTDFQAAKQAQHYEAGHRHWTNDEIDNNTFKDARLAQRLRADFKIVQGDEPFEGKDVQTRCYQSKGEIMAAPYSLDLRRKVVQACNRPGQSQRAVAELFGVSLSFVAKYAAPGTPQR